MINNAVHYYQTPCNIASIVEQLSNYNSVLREEIETEEDVFIRQQCKISDENSHESKLSASATEHIRKRMEDKREENDNKIINNAWIKSKTQMPTTCFVTKCKNKEEHDNENDKSNKLIDANDNQCNQHKVLISEDEKEEDEECHKMACEDESSVVMANEDTH